MSLMEALILASLTGAASAIFTTIAVVIGMKVEMGYLKAGAKDNKELAIRAHKRIDVWEIKCMRCQNEKEVSI